MFICNPNFLESLYVWWVLSFFFYIKPKKWDVSLDLNTVRGKSSNVIMTHLKWLLPFLSHLNSYVELWMELLVWATMKFRSKGRNVIVPRTGVSREVLRKWVTQLGTESRFSIVSLKQPAFPPVLDLVLIRIQNIDVILSW